MFPNIDRLLLLNELSAVHRNQVVARSSQKRNEQSEAIIWQGDPFKAVFCILSGEIEIYRLSPSGREQILDRMTTGQWFNLVPALLPNGKNQANVRALTDCQLLVIRRSEFLRTIEEIPAFGMAVTRYFALRLARLTDLAELLSLYSVRQRLARFLVDQADHQSGTMHWTQADFANRLGTVRDVIGRVLRKMADEGLLRVEREKILLLNREKLERAADWDE